MCFGLVPGWLWPFDEGHESVVDPQEKLWKARKATTSARDPAKTAVFDETMLDDQLQQLEGRRAASAQGNFAVGGGRET